MRRKEIERILLSAKAHLDHPLFYPRIFALAAKFNSRERLSAADHLEMLIKEEYEELSRRLDRSQVQESCTVRNILRARKIAYLLIDEKGDFNTFLLPSLIAALKNHLYSLGPLRGCDAKRQEHILNALQHLQTDKNLTFLLKKFSRPINNRWADELIRYTLQLPSGENVTDAQTRRAALSAWLCYLRQNVGSCFATAPAEIVQAEQPELFLQDLLDLIATGTLKRTYGGVENSVPLSTSWGGGDLKKPLLIRLSSNGIEPEIWRSPGLIAAFEAVGFFKSDDRLIEKMRQVEGWIKPLLQKFQHQTHCILTAEEIIRSVLMQAQGISEKQLKEYESRPRTQFQSQLIVQTSIISKNSNGIGDRCQHFLNQLDIAKNVFKSLSDNALLKAWEFTIASFSDIKYEFARWNFYASLGLQTNEEGGIGQCIYQIIQHKLDFANRKVQDIQYEYEMVYTQVKTLEARMRSATSERDAQWLKIEHQSHLHEFYSLEEQRNAAQSKASALVNLYDTLYKLYVELFKDYFQEVYDADMQEITTGPFDDSPAGFRLLYKHGRTNPSQWTLIKDPQDFIDSLVSFFVATESQIAHELDRNELERDLSEVVTGIINHVKTKEFLETSFYRMAAAHKTPLIKDPLNHLDQIEKKPWGYTSGGTMNTLASCYYRIEDRPKEAEKWVENEMELLVFIADTLKQIPPRFLEPYFKGKRYSILMQSPTHAFLLKPMSSPFKEAWMNDEFTYTFIRDHFVRPAEIFVERILLDDEMLNYLMQKMSEKIPENFQPRFQAIFRKISGPLNPLFFREYLAEILQTDRGLRLGREPILELNEIDGILYSSLPLFHATQLKERVDKILSLIPGVSKEKADTILELVDEISMTRGQRPILSAEQLQEICKALLILSDISTTSSIDYHLHVSLAAQKLGFAMPAPLIFADSNWVRDMFGFVVSPGTGKLELWRLDYTGSRGRPMSSWKQWLDGSRPDLRWSIYVKPFEYGQVF